MYVKSVGLFTSRLVSSQYCVRYYKNTGTKKLLEFLAEMPKANTTRITAAQHQRKQIQKKSEKYGSSTVYLQVLGSGARGVPNTLYLFTDQKRYLFNCGECTQRLAHEHKVKLSRLDHIFITSKTWKNIGGLPGLSLTLQDVGVPNITLHGPEGLDELYNATKRFVIMKEMKVTMAPCSPAEDFEDGVMSVKYVHLGPQESVLKPAVKRLKTEPPKVDKDLAEFMNDDTDYYRRDANSKAKPVPSRKSPEPQASVKKTDQALHELQKPNNSSVAYICTLKKRLGTLDLEKCVSRGVRPGPMLGQLKAGHDVVLPDGTIVLSKDVKTPDDPGPVFIVLEVEDVSYLRASDFSAHFDNGANPPENIPTVIVHLSAPHIVRDPEYRSFIANFGPSTQHLVVNEQNSCLGSEAVHRTQHKLHLLDPDIFPLLRDVMPAVWTPNSPVEGKASPSKMKGLEELKKKIALAQFQNIINIESTCKGDGTTAVSLSPDGSVKGAECGMEAARTLTVFHLRPKKELDRSAEPKLHIQNYLQETMEVDGFVASLETFRRAADSLRYRANHPPSPREQPPSPREQPSSPREQPPSPRDHPRAVFLGTGSCIPSKTRNTSAIHLQLDENSSLLLDCGEGTLAQLVRFYGPKRVNAVLRTLKAIYISHLHADHHIGTIGVIQARARAFQEASLTPEPLHLLAPGQIMSWLAMYDQQFERIRGDFTLVPNQNLLYTARGDCTITPILSSLGVHNIETCLVSHCPNAFGVAITVDEHNKITYSGDTIPCDELAVIGANSTLLIHEATMEDSLAAEARIKMHSTTSQAIDMGRKMNARYTILTHFSQRYARLPRLSPAILNDNCRVAIAFDNMQITMSDLEILPQMYAPLQLMFADHCVEMELKAAQRARQRDRSPRRRRRGSSSRTSDSSSRGSSFPSYVETNASRLRQELKGQPVSGIIRRPTSATKTAPSTPRPAACKPVIAAVASNQDTRPGNVENLNKKMHNIVNDHHTIKGQPTIALDVKTAKVPEVLQKKKVYQFSRIPVRRNSSRPVSPAPTQLSGATSGAPGAAVAGARSRSRSRSRSSTPVKGEANRRTTAPRPITTAVNPPKNILQQPHIPRDKSLAAVMKRSNENILGVVKGQQKKKKSLFRTPLAETFCSNSLMKEDKPVFGKSFNTQKQFKPQLEDIKSSQFFINEPQQKPKPLIEDQRRQMLLEAKKKFTSKAYYNESSMPTL
ncbi:hypothetical protein JYU34_013030 [Plutella xylostella]|uniref:ribonuclease Z n=1 Tax=Plutella xylostella TaxID=51655 RepID=A0ABQ7QCR8_PLUXY|nr:hypothetical protein JYU34_013030 [Plutella xylostella]